MKGSVNKVILLGRVGQDPEVKHTSAGVAVAEFSVATTSYPDVTQWHRIKAWDKNAEFAAKHLTKGMRVHIVGEVQYRSYEDKEGNKRYVTEIRVEPFGLTPIFEGSDEPAAKSDKSADDVGI